MGQALHCGQSVLCASFLSPDCFAILKPFNTNIHAPRKKFIFETSIRAILLMFFFHMNVIFVTHTLTHIEMTGNVVLSVSLVTVNKIIMKTYGFQFVLVLSTCHFIATGIFLPANSPAYECTNPYSFKRRHNVLRVCTFALCWKKFHVCSHMTSILT